MQDNAMFLLLGSFQKEIGNFESTFLSINHLKKICWKSFNFEKKSMHLTFGISWNYHKLAHEEKIKLTTSAVCRKF